MCGGRGGEEGKEEEGLILSVVSAQAYLLGSRSALLGGRAAWSYGRRFDVWFHTWLFRVLGPGGCGVEAAALGGEWNLRTLEENVLNSFLGFGLGRVGDNYGR